MRAPQGSAAKVGVLYTWGSCAWRRVRYMGIVAQACFGAVFVASPKRRLRFHEAAFAAPSGRAAACSRAYASRIAAAGAAASLSIVTPDDAADSSILKKRRRVFDDRLNVVPLGPLPAQRPLGPAAHEVWFGRPEN